MFSARLVRTLNTQRELGVRSLTIRMKSKVRRKTDLIGLWSVFNSKTECKLRSVWECCIGEKPVVPCNPDSLGLYGQVNKRIWWMPWQLEAMKDVVVCDKRRGADNKR